MNCQSFLSFLTCGAEQQITGDEEEKFGHSDHKDQKIRKRHPTSSVRLSGDISGKISRQPIKINGSALFEQ